VAPNTATVGRRAQGEPSWPAHGARVVYSADEQADDATGGDAGAEELLASGPDRAVGDEAVQMPHGPS